MGWVTSMANALAGASVGWLALGVLLHLANQAARGRGWYAIVRAASPDDPGLRRRDAVLAWVAGAGAGGVVSARGGDIVRVLLLSRRTECTRGSVLTGTLVAEAAGDALVGAAVIGLAMALGAAPHFGVPGAQTLAIAGGVLALLVLAGLVLRRRGGRASSIAAGIGSGCAPLAHPRAFARSVLPWQTASRALRAAAIACFLLAFGLPAGIAAVLLVMLAQSGGRLLPLAPASAAASVAMLAAGFGPATGAAVPAATVAAFMLGMSLLLTLAGAVLGVAVICLTAGPGAPAAVWRAVRPRRAAKLQPQE